MITFLTSSFIKYQKDSDYRPIAADTSNGFVDNLRRVWRQDARIMMFASDPDDYEMTDRAAIALEDSLVLAGLSVSEVRVFDHRNSDEAGCLSGMVEWADVIFLAGGHLPTQNRFMKECGLKSALGLDRNVHGSLDSDAHGSFDGIVIGLSAGTMNCASTVYMMPELQGEAADPEFERFADGLGITDIQIIPHAKDTRQLIVDGMNSITDIAAADSRGRRFYLIEDGSYFVVKNGVTEFFGSGEIIENGEFRKIDGGIIFEDCHAVNNKDREKPDELTTMPSTAIATVTSLFNKAYDVVADIDVSTGRMTCYHVSPRYTENGIIPIFIDTIDEFGKQFAEKLVVQDEKQCCVEQIGMSTILEEIERDGEYVRTVHTEIDGLIEGNDLRIRPVLGCRDRVTMVLVNISFILNHDWMTDEFSRSGFYTAAEEKIKELDITKGYSIVYTNIRGFRAVNELLGTQSGDMVIFQEKYVLRSVLKPLILARLESDHYLLLTADENLTEENLEILSNQVYEEDFRQFKFSITCGIYRIKDASASVHSMADRAKLAEKSIGEQLTVSHKVYDDKMSDEYLNIRVLISQLDSALEKMEFKAYYQPVVDAKTGEIVSAEALIRWHHHERGLIMPGQFIEAFEQGGLISKVDYFMLKSVVNFNQSRLNSGKKTVPCAVNLSRVDFFDLRLINLMMNYLSEHEQVQKIIKLEVTESAYSVLENSAMDVLNNMKELGIAILLDDFGSGMSSLSTLESYDFDIIKIDLGFTRKIGKSEKSENVIKAIINLSHLIGAKVVAEGVETEMQLEFLRSVGCDMIQGYYFYKPMSEEEFAALLDREGNIQ